MRHPIASPWRILFVITSSDIGGTERILQQIVARLDRREFDPVVVSLRPTGRVGKEIAAGGVPVITFGLPERPHLLSIVKGVILLRRVIGDFRIDIVQSFLYRANVIARLATRLSRRRAIVVSGHRSLMPLEGKVATMVARWTTRLADRHVVVSRAVRDRLLRTQVLPPEDVILIENGVDTFGFDSQEEVADRSLCGLEPSVPVVGAVGRLSVKKGLRDLVQALASVRSAGTSLDLIIVGDGPERKNLEDQVLELGLNGHVKFLGVIRDLRRIYAVMDIFALPSYEEGSPNSLLEAMAAGRAIVATQVGGIPEMIEDGCSGVLVKPGSSEELAKALQRLVADSALRQSLGDEARKRARERFDISRMVSEYARLYKELLTSPRPGV